MRTHEEKVCQVNVHLEGLGGERRGEEKSSLKDELSL
jgi:hypothetical protein